MSCPTHCFQGEYKYGCKYGYDESCDIFPGTERIAEMITLDLMRIFEKTIDTKYLNFTRNKCEYSELTTQLCFISWRTGYENSDMIYDEIHGDY